MISMNNFWSIRIAKPPRPSLNPLRLGCLAAVMFALAACGPRYPLGIDEALWQTMSAEDRIRAHEQQALLDRAAAERRAAEARAREAEAQHRQAVLAQARRDARYGERVQCVLADAEARLGGKWRRVEPVALDLVQGVPLPFDLTEPSGRIRYRSPVHAKFDGQTVILCRGEVGRERSDDRDCARMLGTQADYRRGMEAYINAPNFLRGHLRCDLVPVAGGPFWPGYRK